MAVRRDLRESFERRRQRPLVHEVRDELERMILAGEAPAGARLNEHSLAAQMGVSRAPVREAARSLEREGLVRTVTNQGVFVRELSLDDALELYELRALIAGHLCARVAETATAETKSELRAFVARMQDAADANDGDTYFAENIAFHDRIAEAAGPGRARTLYVALGKEVRLMRLRVLSGKASLAPSNREHTEIVAAIARGDADAARRAGADHHLNGKKRLLETL
ncbi:MAG: GntR family transcriptional regulator [Pseudomonadota bacterium]